MITKQEMQDPCKLVTSVVIAAIRYGQGLQRASCACVHDLSGQRRAARTAGLQPTGLGVTVDISV